MTIDNKIPVVLSTDHNFIMPTGVCIKSMLDNAEGSAYSIYILCADSVTESDKEKLRAIVDGTDSDIDFLKMGSDLDNAHEVRGISTATYYRLKIPWLLPQYDKVLYIDGDIIVKGSLEKLYDVDLAEYYIAGVRVPGFASRKSHLKHIAKLGITKGEYINAGVLVVNSKKWRDDSVFDLISPHLTKKYLFQDQDILNMVFSGKIKFVPLKYNMSGYYIGKQRESYLKTGTVTAEEMEAANMRPVIIHYAGNKPWKTFTQRWWDWWEIYETTRFYKPTDKLQVAYNALNQKKSILAQCKDLAKDILGIRNY